MTRGDAIAEILRTSPGGLHVKHIVEKLKEYNFEVHTHSAVGIMKNDAQKRFKALGHSYYDLADDYRSNANGNGYKARPSFRRIKGLKGMTLKGAVLLVIEPLEGEFGQPDVYTLLTKRFPESAPDILKETITVTLNNLMRRDGVLDEVYKGHARYPKLYKKTELYKAALKAVTDRYGKSADNDLLEASDL